MVFDLDKFDLGDCPSLVVAIVTVPEGDWLVVDISATPDIETLSPVIPDVLLTA